MNERPHLRRVPMHGLNSTAGVTFITGATSAYVLQPISAFSPPRMLQAAHRMAVPRGACVSTKHVDGACDSWGWTHYCAGVPSDNHVICAVSSLRPTSQPYTAVMLQYVSLATFSWSCPPQQRLLHSQIDALLSVNFGRSVTGLTY